jgi:hypothetical protein
MFIVISPMQCNRFELNDTGQLLHPLPRQIPVIQLPPAFTAREFDVPFHVVAPIDSLLPNNDTIGLSDGPEIDLASFSIEMSRNLSSTSSRALRQTA